MTCRTVYFLTFLCTITRVIIYMYIYISDLFDDLADYLTDLFDNTVAVLCCSIL